MQQVPDQVAVPPAVAKIDHEPNQQPDHQPQPRVQRQEEHQRDVDQHSQPHQPQHGAPKRPLGIRTLDSRISTAAQTMTNAISVPTLTISASFRIGVEHGHQADHHARAQSGDVGHPDSSPRSYGADISVSYSG